MRERIGIFVFVERQTPVSCSQDTDPNLEGFQVVYGLRIHVEAGW